jgi:hypothetical protein
MNRLTALRVGCLTLLTVLTQITQAQNLTLPINLPLPGFYLFRAAPAFGMSVADSLFKVDTESGDVQTLVSGERYITSLRISHNGEWAAYGTLANAFQFVQIPSSRLQTIRDPIPDALHYPVGWSPGNNALIFKSSNLFFPGSIDWLNQYDRQTGTLTRILELPGMSLLADALPAYANIASRPAYITSLKSVEASPLDPNWIILGLDLTSYEVVPTAEGWPDLTQPDPNFWTEYLLWNSVTGQVISIESALPTHWQFEYGDARWRPDRLEFIASIYNDLDRRSHDVIFRLEPTATSEWQLRTVEIEVSTADNASVVDWIGIGPYAS